MGCGLRGATLISLTLCIYYIIEFEKNQILTVNFKWKILEVRASLCGTDKRKWFILPAGVVFPNFSIGGNLRPTPAFQLGRNFPMFQLSAWSRIPAFQLVGNIKGKSYGRGMGGMRPRGNGRERWENWKNMEIRCLTSKTAYCFFTNDSV